MSKASWNEISETAVEVGRDWTNRDAAAFHYFNPNGLAARKRALDDQISNAVDAGRARSGAIVAYGSFADFSMRDLRDLAAKQRVAGRNLSVVLSMLSRDIDRAEAFLASLDAKEAA